MGGSFSTSSSEPETRTSGCPCYTTASEHLTSYTRSRGGSLKCKYSDGGFVKYTSKNKPKDENTLTTTLVSGEQVYCIDAQTEVSYK